MGLGPLSGSRCIAGMGIDEADGFGTECAMTSKMMPLIEASAVLLSPAIPIHNLLVAGHHRCLQQVGIAGSAWQ